MTKRDQRALLIGLASVLLLVLTPRIATKWRGVTSMQESRAQKTGTQLAQFAQMRATHEEVNETLRQRELMKWVADSMLISSGSSMEICSDFAEMLSEAARLSDVSIGSVRVEIDSGLRKRTSSSGRRQLLYVSTRISVTGLTSAVFAFINWLETTPPLLSIDEFIITAGQQNTVPGQSQLQVMLRIRGIGSDRVNDPVRPLKSPVRKEMAP